MKKYLGLLCLLLIGVVVVVVGLAMISQSGPDTVGSDEWCEAMVLKPNKAWTDQETRDFASACLYE
jgi:Protein of unknown function (DUF3012)